YTGGGSGPNRRPAVPCTGVHPSPHPGRASGCRLRALDAADLTSRASTLDQLDLLLGTAAPAHREATRHQVVPAIPARDLDDIAGGAQARDLLSQDKLHRGTAHRSFLPRPQRAVLVYGSSAISRAFLIAVATSRWCRVQLPETRRARILPRSEMNLRSVAVSL